MPYVSEHLRRALCRECTRIEEILCPYYELHVTFFKTFKCVQRQDADPDHPRGRGHWWRGVGGKQGAGEQETLGQLCASLCLPPICARMMKPRNQGLAHARTSHEAARCGFISLVCPVGGHLRDLDCVVLHLVDQPVRLVLGCAAAAAVGVRAEEEAFRRPCLMCRGCRCRAAPAAAGTGRGLAVRGWRLLQVLCTAARNRRALRSDVSAKRRLP